MDDSSPLFREISSLATELNNPATRRIDTLSTIGILDSINTEDYKVIPAVREEIPNIALAVDAIVERFKLGGRLIYAGAGTSGRLGVVDASECPPTFGVEPDMVLGIIAGGNAAMFSAQEGAEDKPEEGAALFDLYSITKSDVVCAIAASGRTPFVRGFLEEAKIRKIYSILLTTNTRENLQSIGVDADCIIAPQVGPEILAGSTRMKSGTAQKLVLNMITTTSMIRLGKTFGNVMVDLQLTNAKLVERAKNIIMTTTGCTYAQATSSLENSNGHVKTAIVMILGNIDAQSARENLQRANGFVRDALENISTVR